MDGTIQAYVLDMAADTKKEPLRVKQYDTNSRQARITLKMGGEPWTIPFGCQIHINVRKTDGKLADATCTREDEHTVLAPITEQMTAVTGTQLGELYFLGSDGDIKTQTFPVVVYEAVMDQARIESSDDFQSLQDALRDVKTSTASADRATQYATEQGDQARDAAQRAEDAAASIQVAVDAAAAAKECESNAKDSELAAAQTQQEVTDYVEAQKAAFVGYSQRESDSKYANALTATATGEGGVTVEDAWTAPVLGLEVTGKSEQVVTTGAQLLDFEQCLNDWNSKYTCSDGRVYTVNTLGTGFQNPISFSDEDIKVTLSGNVRDISGSKYRIELLDSSGNVVGRIQKDTKSITVMASKIRLNFTEGGAGEYADIMLNAGSAILPYEPYTGGAPSPSPDYPQDIISTGTVSTGAQLFYKSLVTLQGTGAEADIIDKRAIKITYTRANGGKYAGFIVDDKSNIVGRTLTISYGSVILSKSDLTPGIRLYWIDNNGYVLSSAVYANKSPTTITIEDPQNDRVTKLALLLYADIGDTAVLNDYVIYKDIMINAGDTALPWEPYTGGKPSPSVEYPQTLNIHSAVGNRNLLKKSGIPITTNSYFMKSYFFGDIKPVDGETYTIQVKGKLGTGKTELGIFNSGGSVWEMKFYPNDRGESGIYTKTFVWKIKNNGNTAKNISLDVYAVPNSVDSVSTIEWIKLEKGELATPWVPAPEDITPENAEQYSDIIHAAAITLTEPLRGIGEYRDRIMCRDGVWGIERYWKSIMLDGNIPYREYNQLNVSKEIRANEGIIKIKPINGLFSNLKIVAVTWDNDKLGIGCFTSGPVSNPYRSISLRIPVDADVAEYMAANPTEVIYQPYEYPTWEPLPDATQQALNSLTTYTGTTHLTVTAGGPAPTVTLDYVKDTHKAFEQCQEAAKEYTDTQIAAIVAALPTATQAAIVDNQTTRLLQEV